MCDVVYWRGRNSCYTGAEFGGLGGEIDLVGGLEDRLVSVLIELHIRDMTTDL